MKTETETDPRQVLADLEERVREGDSGVSAVALAKARQAADLAALHDEASARRAEREASERRQADVTALQKDIAAERERLTELSETYAGIVAALMAFNEALSKWRDKRRALAARAKLLGESEEVEILPSLERDWLSLASGEAQRRYERSSRSFIEGSTTHPIAHHELRSSKERERIDTEEAERVKAMLERRRVHDEEQRQERAETEQRQRELEERQREVDRELLAGVRRA